MWCDVQSVLNLLKLHFINKTKRVLLLACELKVLPSMNNVIRENFRLIILQEVWLLLDVIDSSCGKHGCYILPEGCQLEALVPLLPPDSWLDHQPPWSCGPRNDQISSSRMPLLVKKLCSDA